MKKKRVCSLARKLGLRNLLLLSLLTGHWPLTTGHFLLAAGHSQDRIIIDADFPGGYQVEVADVNGDRKPDVVALGGSTCAWYENPTWKKRIVTTGKQTPGIISSATADLDGDGKAEIAIAYEFEMNEPTRGKLALAGQGQGLEDHWQLISIAEVGSIHRLRWGDLDGDGKLDLVVAPIFGAQARPPKYDDPVALQVFRFEGDSKNGRWKGHATMNGLVLHAIEVRPALEPRDRGRWVIMAADNRGVTLLHEAVYPSGGMFTVSSRLLVPGAEGEPPFRGCSEVHLGKFKDGRRFLATIEPWHGTEVVVWPEQDSALRFGSRTVLDSTLEQGHALWVADVDGDGDDEVFAGHRGKDHRVSMYDFDHATGKWIRAVLDREIAAQDLRGGDLDGDGTPDVVAIGGATHNVVWYRPKRR
jgi:hypothetical protein